MLALGAVARGSARRRTAALSLPNDPLVLVDGVRIDYRQLPAPHG